MARLIQKFTLIIVINLFAFLSVGYILDEIFKSGARFKIIFLVLSVFSLVFLSHLLFKKTDFEGEGSESKNQSDKIIKENDSK